MNFFKALAPIVDLFALPFLFFAFTQNAVMPEWVKIPLIYMKWWLGFTFVVYFGFRLEKAIDAFKHL